MKIKNLNIKDKSTDELKEGNTNLYFSDSRTCNLISQLLNDINSDFIKEGISNLYYTPERDSNAFITNFLNFFLIIFIGFINHINIENLIIYINLNIFIIINFNFY